MGYIAAIDLSLRSTGVARYHTINMDRHSQTVTSVKNVRIPAWQRQDTIVQEIVEMFAPADLVFIEGYAFASPAGASSLATLAELGGILKHRIWKTTQIYPISVAPTTIKKFLTGKGNTSKPDMILPAFRKYGREFPNSDELDAYVLLDLALCALGLGADDRKLNLKERECVAVVQKELTFRGIA